VRWFFAMGSMFLIDYLSSEASVDDTAFVFESALTKVIQRRNRSSSASRIKELVQQRFPITSNAVKIMRKYKNVIVYINIDSCMCNISSSLLSTTVLMLVVKQTKLEDIDKLITDFKQETTHLHNFMVSYISDAKSLSEKQINVMTTLIDSLKDIIPAGMTGEKEVNNCTKKITQAFQQMQTHTPSTARTYSHEDPFNNTVSYVYGDANFESSLPLKSVRPMWVNDNSILFSQSLFGAGSQDESAHRTACFYEECSDDPFDNTDTTEQHGLEFNITKKLLIEFRKKTREAELNSNIFNYILNDVIDSEYANF
jgi:hypothetical protein